MTRLIVNARTYPCLCWSMKHCSIPWPSNLRRINVATDKEVAARSISCKACCNAHAATIRTTASRSVAVHDAAKNSITHTLVASARTHIVSRANGCATTSKFAPTFWRKPYGTTYANYSAIRTVSDGSMIAVLKAARRACRQDGSNSKQRSGKSNVLLPD